MTTIQFTINGHERTIEAPPMKRLLDVLREDLHLTGAKEGCGEGECGACAVLINGDLINSCLVPVLQAEGANIMPGLLKENGVEVLDLLTYRTKDTDYSAQITTAKSLGAEGIAFGSCYQNAAAIAKEAHKQGLKVPMVGGACASAPGFIEIAGSAAEGAYMSTAAWLDDPRPEELS